MVEYTTIAAPCEGSYTEKRSEFIAQLFPCTDPDACAAQIDAVRAKHHKARHNVWAYLLREGGISRCSDDGEPQGTGGLPVLSVLQKAGLSDVCCVVTRYFGGVLLGAGGLTRAYSAAAAEAVKNAALLHFCESCRVRLETDYSYYGKLSFLLPEYGIKDAGSEFADKVTLLFDIPADNYPALEARLTELYSGRPAVSVSEVHFVAY